MAIFAKVPRWAIVEKLPIALKRFFRVAAKAAHIEGFPGVFIPRYLVHVTQEILIIVQELLLARPCYISKLQLTFRRSYQGIAAFDDILLSRTGSPHHLINGAVALDEEPPAKPDGKIVNYPRFAKSELFATVTSLGKKTFGVGHRSTMSYRDYAFW